MRTTTQQNNTTRGQRKTETETERERNVITAAETLNGLNHVIKLAWEPVNTCEILVNTSLWHKTLHTATSAPSQLSTQLYITDCHAAPITVTVI